MKSAVANSLWDVRQNLLGFSEEAAARLSGVRVERIRQLENGTGAPMTVSEADALGKLYGLDEETISAPRVLVSKEDAIHTLASRDEFHEVGDSVRANVVAAARAARDIVRLRSRLGIPSPSVPRLGAGTAADVPWMQGRAAAEDARREIGPHDDKPLLSVRDWVRDFLPGVPTLYAHLGDSGPAGLTFAGSRFGPALVLNLDGKNTNPCVRRFSLAHEVYHLLVDWDRVEPIATLSGYLEEGESFEREQRANSFAIRFQCPESNVRKFPVTDQEAAKILIVKWGLHYQAARLYLRNARNASLPAIAPPSVQADGNEADWIRAEHPDGLDGFPLLSVKPERRTLVAKLAAQAYASGVIPRDEFAEYLGVPPGEDLEVVLGRFGFDPPTDYAAA